MNTRKSANRKDKQAKIAENKGATNTKKKKLIQFFHKTSSENVVLIDIRTPETGKAERNKNTAELCKQKQKTKRPIKREKHTNNAK
ncbi:hypothetical protein [Synechococcus sp. CC9311]|uniref:hypothetical protein n=1 Tax=Synechococcus sp. (strain CC9311) TaxID=64471 RepID=UPI00059CB78E|nr:hypothetical protein [Synechococcus sp. CC9311]